jgi:hypothetical protein
VVPFGFAQGRLPHHERFVSNPLALRLAEGFNLSMCINGSTGAHFARCTNGVYQAATFTPPIPTVRRHFPTALLFILKPSSVRESNFLAVKMFTI